MLFLLFQIREQNQINKESIQPGGMKVWTDPFDRPGKPGANQILNLNLETNPSSDFSDFRDISARGRSNDSNKQYETYLKPTPV